MKLVDEKGRLFGAVNIVDLIIGLAVLFAVFAIGTKLFATPIKEAVSPNAKMTTVFRIRGATDLIQAEIAKNPLHGEKLLSGNDYVDAVVTDVKIEDYAIQTSTDDGRIVTALDPVKKDIVITVESSIAKNTPNLKIGNQEVRAGRTFIFKTRSFEMVCNVETVSVDD